LSNEDFRKLLTTPRPAPSAGSSVPSYPQQQKYVQGYGCAEYPNVAFSFKSLDDIVYPLLWDGMLLKMWAHVHVIGVESPANFRSLIQYVVC